MCRDIARHPASKAPQPSRWRQGGPSHRRIQWIGSDSGNRLDLDSMDRASHHDRWCGCRRAMARVDALL